MPAVFPGAPGPPVLAVGAFARAARLPPKALRRCDEPGLPNALAGTGFGGGRCCRAHWGPRATFRRSAHPACHRTEARTKARAGDRAGDRCLPCSDGLTSAVPAAATALV